MESKIRNLYNNDILLNALEAFGADQEYKTLDGFESYVYEVKINSERRIMKISHSSRRSKELILAELEFINHLNNNGLIVPNAVISVNKNLCEVFPVSDGYFTAAVYEFAKGSHATKDNWNEKLFFKMGRYLGKIHSISKTYKKTCRPDIFEESEKDVIKFIPPEDTLVRQRADELFSELRELDITEDSFGLIHVDFHRGNFFYDNENIYLFDFDDCQYSWFVHDITMSIFYALPHHTTSDEQIEKGHNFINHFLKGYFTENTLEKKWIYEIPKFLKLREIELYAVIHRSFDDYEEDEWASSFMKNRKYKIQNSIPYFPIDFDNLKV